MSTDYVSPPTWIVIELTSGARYCGILDASGREFIELRRADEGSQLSFEIRKIRTAWHAEVAEYDARRRKADSVRKPKTRARAK